MTRLPPDGARLCDLDERRRWLGRVEIVYALPRTGMLLVIDAETSVAIDSATITLRSDGQRLERALDPEARQRFVSLWHTLWLDDDAGETDPDGRVVLLHHHGLLGPRRSASLLDAIDVFVASALD